LVDISFRRATLSTFSQKAPRKHVVEVVTRVARNDIGTKLMLRLGRFAFARFVYGITAFVFLGVSFLSLMSIGIEAIGLSASGRLELYEATFELLFVGPYLLIGFAAFSSYRRWNRKEREMFDKRQTGPMTRPNP